MKYLLFALFIFLCLPAVGGVVISGHADRTIFVLIAPTSAFNSTLAHNLIGNGSPRSTSLLPPNFLQPGQGFRLRAAGSLTCSAGSPTLTIAFNLGATNIFTTAAFTPVARAESWTLDLTFIGATTGGVGFAGQECDAAFLEISSTAQTAAVTTPIRPGASSLDTTQSYTLALTGQWSAAATSNNFSCTRLIIETIPAP